MEADIKAEAIDIANQALKKDADNDRFEALRLYNIAVDHFLHITNCKLFLLQYFLK